MKLVHIIPTLERGGAERIVVDLLCHIDRKKFDPTLIILKEGGPLLEEITDADIPHRLFSGYYPKGPLLIKRIASELKDLKPDIVHTHLFGGDAWGVLGARKAQVPCIVTTEHNLNRDENLARRKIKARAFRYLSKLIAVSKAVAGFAEITYKVPKDIIDVIPNGIKIEKYTQDHRENEQFRIGAFGRLEKQKGFDFLLGALALLPDKDWQCIIAGEGSRRRALESRARKLKIIDRVQFLGSREDIPALLSTLDVFVLPSLWEGQGISLLEAGAASVPIVASRVDGIAEMLSGKEAALLTAPGDARGIMASIRWVREQKKAAEQMAERWRKIIVKEYTLEKMVQRYEEVYLSRD